MSEMLVGLNDWLSQFNVLVWVGALIFFTAWHVWFPFWLKRNVELPAVWTVSGPDSDDDNECVDHLISVEDIEHAEWPWNLRANSTGKPIEVKEIIYTAEGGHGKSEETVKVDKVIMEENDYADWPQEEDKVPEDNRRGDRPYSQGFIDGYDMGYLAGAEAERDGPGFNTPPASPAAKSSQPHAERAKWAAMRTEIEAADKVRLEEYVRGYNEGSRDGHIAGYEDGFNDAQQTVGEWNKPD